MGGWILLPHHIEIVSLGTPSFCGDVDLINGVRPRVVRLLWHHKHLCQNIRWSSYVSKTTWNGGYLGLGDNNEESCDCSMAH